MRKCQCVFPAPSEDELITIAGDEPGRAWRVFVECSCEGYVRVQELAHDCAIGWYVQKTMVLPREVVAALAPQLRKALCLMAPGREARAVESVSYMRIAGDAERAA